MGRRAAKWTERQDEILREGYELGVPLREISAQLRGKFGTNAITGRAFRLGLKHNSRYSAQNRMTWQTRRERYGACGAKPFEFPSDG